MTPPSTKTKDRKERFRKKFGRLSGTKVKKDTSSDYGKLLDVTILPHITEGVVKFIESLLSEQEREIEREEREKIYNKFNKYIIKNRDNPVAEVILTFLKRELNLSKSKK